MKSVPESEVAIPVEPRGVIEECADRPIVAMVAATSGEIAVSVSKPLAGGHDGRRHFQRRGQRWRGLSQNVMHRAAEGDPPVIDVVIIAVDAKGQIVRIDRAGQALRHPGMPIPAAITRLTGITDAHVRDKVIDLDALEALTASADVRIAHNAPFDVALVERLLPGVTDAAWARFAQDFDWLEHGFDGAKLGHLLMQIGRLAPDRTL